MMALKAEIENTTLNVKLRSDNGFECRMKMWWWLWTPNPAIDGSEHWYWEVITMALNVNEDVMMALNVETEDATLNVDLKTDDGSECRTEKWQWWLWTPKLKSDDDDSERQTEKWWWLWTSKSRMRLWMSIWKPMMALNAETKKWWWHWTPNWKHGDGSERRN